MKAIWKSGDAIFGLRGIQETNEKDMWQQQKVGKFKWMSDYGGKSRISTDKICIISTWLSVLFTV